MKTLVFVVREPGRKVEEIEVCADRLLVGSGAHCDLRLPPESAAWEHVVVTQEGDAVVARVVTPDLAMSIGGESKRELELDEGVAIGLGGVVVELVRVRREATTKRGSSTTGRIAVVLSGVVIALGLLIIQRATAGEREAPWPDAPDPIGPEITTCPEKQGAAPLAQERFELARTKRERFQFYPRDGVEGVASFQAAAACFRAAGDPVSARDADEAALALASDVRHELHASRVRLERALVRGHGRTALAQVRFQRALLFGSKDADAYVAWLAVLQSKLEAALSKQD